MVINFFLIMSIASIIIGAIILVAGLENYYNDFLFAIGTILLFFSFIATIILLIIKFDDSNKNIVKENTEKIIIQDTIVDTLEQYELTFPKNNFKWN